LVNIIGIGGFSCGVVDLFDEAPQYNTYKIDFGLEKTKTTRGLTLHKDPQKIEEKCPSMSYFFKGMNGESHLFVEGRDPSTAATLRVLESTNHKEVNLFYIHPEEVDLQGDTGKNENVAYHVLQEYARSNLLNNIYLIKVDQVEKSLGEVSLINYYDVIKQTISSTIQMVDFFQNTKPVIETRGEESDLTRIGTYGIIDFDKGSESLFFPLDNIMRKHYYYGINSEDLKSDGSLIKKIREQVKYLKGKDTIATYSVHETTYEQPQVIVVAKTSIIQERNNESL
jgi:hypothetical protein